MEYCVSELTLLTPAIRLPKCILNHYNRPPKHSGMNVKFSKR